MTKIQILKKAIEKAIKNGYRPSINNKRVKTLEEARFVLNVFEEMSGYEEYIKKHWYKIVIFSHDFAKAFWGERNICPECGRKYLADPNTWLCEHCGTRRIYQPAWQYHLQQMILEKDPLKYLEKFL